MRTDLALHVDVSRVYSAFLDVIGGLPCLSALCTPRTRLSMRFALAVPSEMFSWPV